MHEKSASLPIRLTEILLAAAGSTVASNGFPPQSNISHVATPLRSSAPYWCPLFEFCSSHCSGPSSCPWLRSHVCSLRPFRPPENVEHGKAARLRRICTLVCMCRATCSGTGGCVRRAGVSQNLRQVTKCSFLPTRQALARPVESSRFEGGRTARRRRGLLRACLRASTRRLIAAGRAK